MSIGSGETPPYELQLRDEHWDEIRSWGERQQEILFTFLRDHASRSPTAPLAGSLKRLKDPYRGLYQFRVDRERRFIYRVDEDLRAVVVVYVGPHPDWRKSRRRGITR